jgi:hypothetical protein
MTGEPLNGDWTMVRRRHNDGRGLARKGENMGVKERRGQAVGVGVFRRGGGLFIGPGEGRRGGEGG